MGTSLGKRFGQLWAASASANLGDGVLAVALMLVAARLTDSATLVAAVAVASQLPNALATLPAGALADRLDRRRLMFIVNLVRASTVAVGAALEVTGSLSLPAVYLIAFVLGASEVFVDATAQSTVPMVVARDRLPAANGRLVATQVTANEFVGAPLAGVLVAAAVVWALAAPAAFYLVAALLLLRMPGHYRPHRDGPPTRIRTDIAEGIRYLTRHRLLRTLAAMAALVNIASGGVFAVFVLYVVGPNSPMQLPEAAFGFLLACVAAGAVLGSVVAERAQRHLGRIRLLMIAVTGFAIAFAVPAMTTAATPVAIALFAAGLLMMLANVIMVSLRQLIVPEGLLGRTNATMRLLGVGLAPVGAALAGPIADLLGLRAVFLGAAALTLLALPGFLVVTEAGLTRAEQHASESPRQGAARR
jgi:MFS family permease